MQHLLAHLSSLPGCVRPPELLTGSLLPSPFRSARTSPAKWQSLPDFHLEMAPQVPAVVSVVRGQIVTVLQLLPVPTAEPRCACSSARSPALPLLPAPLCFLRGILPLIPVCQVSIQWGPGLSWALQSVIHHEIAWTYPCPHFPPAPNSPTCPCCGPYPPQDAGGAPALHAWLLREGKVTGMAAKAGGFSPWLRPVRCLLGYLLYYFVLLWFIMLLLLHSHLFCGSVKPANNVFSLGGLATSEQKINLILLISVWM